MPTPSSGDRVPRIGREPPARMPGEFAASTALCALVACFVVSRGAEYGPLKYVLYVLVILPLAAPTAALVIQYAVVVLRRLVARVAVRRARAVFRGALAAARRHPELADLERLRAAAATLARLAPEDAQRASLEISAALNHPFAPIREAAIVAMRASGEARREARSGPPRSLED